MLHCFVKNVSLISFKITLATKFTLYVRVNDFSYSRENPSPLKLLPPTAQEHQARFTLSFTLLTDFHLAKIPGANVCLLERHTRIGGGTIVGRASSRLAGVPAETRGTDTIYSKYN